MPERVYFIGGPADGQLRMVPKVRTTYKIMENTAVIFGPAEFEEHLYVLRPFKDPHGRTNVYVHESLQDTSILRRLLDTYVNCTKAASA